MKSQEHSRANLNFFQSYAIIFLSYFYFHIHVSSFIILSLSLSLSLYIYIYIHYLKKSMLNRYIYQNPIKSLEVYC